MSNNSIFSEYMHCFNILIEILEFNSAEVEGQRKEDLYEMNTLGWRE